jgi:DNA-directed RNA polymerase subunit RPC12/RpoP
MARVPITKMGYRCERCGHEWLPRNPKREPPACPKCRSRRWDHPAKTEPMLTYEEFRDKIQETLRNMNAITWTEIRTIARLPQAFPNNKWVHRLELDINLKRNKDSNGIIKWSLG